MQATGPVFPSPQPILSVEEEVAVPVLAEAHAVETPVSHQVNHPLAASGKGVFFGAGVAQPTSMSNVDTSGFIIIFSAS
jgi:hypothetical protein